MLFFVLIAVLVAGLAIAFVLLLMPRLHRWALRPNERQIRERIATEGAESVLAETDRRIADLREQMGIADDHAGTVLGRSFGRACLCVSEHEIRWRSGEPESLIASRLLSVDRVLPILRYCSSVLERDDQA